MKLFSVLIKVLNIFPKRVPVIILLMFCSGLFETIGLGIMVPIIEFFLMNVAMKATLFIAIFTYFFKILWIRTKLTYFIWFFNYLFGFKSIIKFVESVLTFQLLRYCKNKLAEQTFGTILNVKWQHYQSKKIGFYHSLFVNEITQYIQAIQFSILILSESLLLLFYICLSFIISWQLSLFVVAFLSISFLAFYSFFQKGRYIGKELQERNNAFSSFTAEFFTLFKWVKTAAKTAPALHDFKTFLHKMTFQDYKTHCFRAVLPAFFLTFAAIALSVICYISLALFKINFASMILLLTIFYRALPKFQSLQQFYQQFLICYPNIAFIDSFIKDYSDQSENFGTLQFKGLSKHIHIKNLHFSYSTTKAKSIFNLKNISTTIEKQQFVAVVGPSGSGKSTFIDLLLGVQTPQKGSIMFDDKVLNHYDLNSLRKHIGLVSQDILLLNASIKENLTWGLPTLSDKAIKTACKAAHALEFIEDLEAGFDTIIGDRGVRLSGGQRQRLGLARALVSNPDILILDEATSALDAESEQFVQDTINDFKGKKTIILISHRLASVKKADHIIVLDKGQIIEEGTWKELSSKKGKFQLFKQLQILE